MQIALQSRLVNDSAKPGGRRWRDNARALYLYMLRNMQDSIDLRCELYPVNGAKHEKRFVPFVWRVVREKTPQHVERIFRRLDGTPIDGAELEAIEREYRTAGIDAAMRSARKQLVALNQSTTWVTPAANNWDLKAFTVPPHMQAVTIGDATSTSEDSVRIWRYEIPVAPDGDGAQMRTAVAYITPAEQYWESGMAGEQGKPVWGESTANALGRVPVAMMRGEEPEPGWWWCEVPEDLLYCQRAINMGLTTTGVVAKMQGFAQAYIRGMTGAQVKDMDVGSEAIIGLPTETAEFGFANPGADLAGNVTVLDQFLQTVVSAEGLSPQTFLKSSGITALAKRIENQSRDAERRWDMPTIIAAEQRVYDLVRDWLRALRGVDVLPEARVTVEVRDVVDVVDPLHDAQARQIDIYAGQTDEVTARAKRDGVSPQEASRRVKESIKVTADLQAMRASIGAPVAPVAGGAEGQGVDDAPDEAATGAGQSENVAALALNGAQVQALQGIVQNVSAGLLPAEAAVLLVTSGFPDIPAEVARRMVASAATVDVAPEPIEPEL